MKWKVIALSSLVFSFPSIALTDLGEAGDIHFTIQIRQGVCELEKDNIDVDMGQAVLKHPVRVGNELNPTSFSIGLKNCDAVNNVYVSMDGTPHPDDPNYFALDSGGATGIGLKIETINGVGQHPIATDLTPLMFAIPANGSHQLNYIASYVPLRADATSGHGNATVNFTVQYE